MRLPSRRRPRPASGEKRNRVNTTTAPANKDALINAISQCIVTDPAAATAPWDGYALIAWYGEDRCVLSGFRYLDNGPASAATPSNGAQLHALFDQLRAATLVAGQSPWRACVVRIVKATRKVSVDFEYEDADRWHIQPGTLSEIIARAQPH